MFLHQAVMEALVGGDTDVAPQDLRITMNKLARIHKTSKKPGYAQEFKVTITLLITSKYRIIIDLTSHPALDPCPVNSVMNRNGGILTYKNLMSLSNDCDADDDLETLF